MAHPVFVILILSIATISFGIKMEVMHEWKYVDYAWNSQEQKQKAINSSNYNPNMCALYDVDKADDGRIFVTTPKEISSAVPATLMTVSKIIRQGSPLLRPYPDWDWYNGSCDGIVNVHRVHIQCNHIFVLDNGKIETDQICQPKLLIFDLKMDTLVKCIYIPPDIANNRMGSGLLVTPIVYVPGNCSRLLNEMIVFMADMQGYGLVVYDSSTNHMCRVESDFMEPTDTVFTIANQNISYVGGIFGMTIIRDVLFYNSVSGKKIYKIKIRDLLECPDKSKANKQTEHAGELSSQTGPIASAECAIFLSNVQEISIVGVNACKKFDSKDMVVLAQDFEKLQAVNGLKVLHHYDELMGLSNKYQHFRFGTANLSEINFRIVKMDLTEILKKVVFSELG